MRAIWALAPVLLAACFDSTGPRPRPGTSTTEPPNPSEPAALLWFETRPRVITQGRSDSIELNVAVAGPVEQVQLQPRTGFPLLLRRVSASLYSGKISPGTLLTGYRSGDLRHNAGILQVFTNLGAIESYLVVNVLDATVPPTIVTTVASGFQAAPHVVNIRVDAFNPGAEVSASVLRTFYNRFADDYAFVAVIEQVRSDKEPFFIAVRNDISGLGIARFDRGGNYGSASALQGIIQYPEETDFDLAQTSNLHVLAHRWMNYSTVASLAGGRPHWPLSSAAFGVLGRSDPQTNESVIFPFEIEQLPDGTYQLHTTEGPPNFNELELYMMGLLPADSVSPQLVFTDQNQQSQIRNNGILHGPVDSVRVSDIIAKDGARAPSAATAPRAFRLATIVLSRGALLSQDEMAFYDHMAARGELRTSVFYSDGFARSLTAPFYVATGNRAALTTIVTQ